MDQETYLVPMTARDYAMIIGNGATAESKMLVAQRLADRWATARGVAREIAGTPKDGWERRPDVVGT